MLYNANAMVNARIELCSILAFTHVHALYFDIFYYFQRIKSFAVKYDRSSEMDYVLALFLIDAPAEMMKIFDAVTSKNFEPLF